jgi:phosphohistidine phosphatase
MGRFLAKTGEEVPDLALTSPAIRAKRTLQLAARAGLWGCPVHERPALYGDVSDLLGEIRSTSDDVRNLLLVGHEPAWSTAARLLSGAAQIRLPTASMLRLGFAVDRWSQIEEGGARIDWLVVPRLLESPRRGRA